MEPSGEKWGLFLQGNAAISGRLVLPLALLLVAGCAEGTDDAFPSGGDADPGTLGGGGQGGASSGAGGPTTGPGSSGPAAGGAGGDGSAGGAGGDGGASAGGGGQGGSGGGGLVGAESCPPGEFVVSVQAGNLVCANADDALRDAVNAHCSVYLGWRDNCDGCTSSPERWGRASGDACQNGLGSSNTCLVANLGGTSIDLFGLNTGGDVDGNDKFYLGLTCDAPPEAITTGPCPAGSLAIGFDGTTVQCASADATAAKYVNDQCSAYLGWRNDCTGCSLSPTKWGHAGKACVSGGTTTNNTCTTPSLGGNSVPLYGLNTDGSVNDDDKFYFGLHCKAAADSGGSASGTCPTGEFMTGIAQDGSLTCSALAPRAQAVVRSQCSLYAGWRNDCGSCSSPPTRWGRVSHDACAVGLGNTGTCSVASLGGSSVRLFGLNPDGDVNSGDKFYVGMSCQ